MVFVKPNQGCQHWARYWGQAPGRLGRGVDPTELVAVLGQTSACLHSQDLPTGVAWDPLWCVVKKKKNAVKDKQECSGRMAVSFIPG